MKRLTFAMLTVGLLIFLLFPVPTSHATTIYYDATDLADTIPGEDLWQYTYTVGDYTFNEDYGFTIYFDYSLYSDLQDPPPSVNTDWDPIVFQPDPPPVPADGIYDAIAVADNASLADPFTVSFVWEGPGVPGSQPFEVYFYDDPDFDIIESGQTVPEPATILLVGSGLFGLAGLRKRAKKTLVV